MSKCQLFRDIFRDAQKNFMFFGSKKLELMGWYPQRVCKVSPNNWRIRVTEIQILNKMEDLINGTSTTFNEKSFETVFYLLFLCGIYIALYGFI